MTRVGKDWSEHGSDFASTIGTGGVVGTKFVWHNPGPKFKPVLLTQEKEAQWKKWIGIYNEKMLSKGTFRNLYVYGYDTPEAYAIEKDGEMYYAFFAPTPASWKGQLELRGLAPGKYHVRDYADSKDLGMVEVGAAGDVPRLNAAFKDHLLLEVGK
jgi:alpha-galactosidase